LNSTPALPPVIAIRRSYRRLAKEQGWIIINSVNDRGDQRAISDIHQEIWQIIKPGIVKLTPINK